MTVTLRDVAEQANVSISTVSRILNKKNSNIPISDATRQRVLHIAQELGYKPNIAARHLVRRQSFSLIGIIMPQNVSGILVNPFFMMTLHGIAQHCQQNGYAVTIHFVNIDDEQMVANLYPKIANIPTDGFIFTLTHVNDHLSQRLMRDNIPYVHIGRLPQPQSWMPQFVDVDNYEGAKLAMTHLLDKGHRRIATIAAPQTMSAGVDRLRGYVDTMQTAGLAIQDDWIAYGDFETVSGQIAAQQFMACAERPTAVFAASDSMAIGLIQALQENGLQVPADIAVVGFDDNPEAATLTPALTTVQQPIAQMGASAATLLLHLIDSNQPAENIILSPQLIVRAST